MLYVAITRAMDACHLSYARQRFRNGTVAITMPSRFLNDIDSQYMAVVENEPAVPARPQWRNSSWADEKPFAAAPKKPLKHVAPNTQHAAAEGLWQTGERVRHKVFGEGEVLRVYRDNDNDKIDIRFDRGGQKTLLLTYAKLERI